MIMLLITTINMIHIRGIPYIRKSLIKGHPFIQGNPRDRTRGPHLRAALKAGFARSRVSSERNRITFHAECNVTLCSMLWGCMVIIVELLVSIHARPESWTPPAKASGWTYVYIYIYIYIHLLSLLLLVLYIYIYIL